MVIWFVLGALLLFFALGPLLRRHWERRKLFAALRGQEKERAEEQPPRASPLDVMQVKGFSYVPQRDLIAPLLRHGEALRLLREPQNPHDCNAVRLLRADGQPLGYLPRRYNAIPAALLDSGMALGARLVLGKGDGRYRRMEVALYWAEDLP